MKYRILFTGDNDAIINDLFENLSEDYELMTSSIRYRDIDSHLNCFKPNMCIYCLDSDTPEKIKKLAELRSYITNEGVQIGVIGTPDECETFQKLTTNMASLIVNLPATLVETMDAIEAYVNKVKADEAKEQERKHILVIDDDPQMLRIIKEMLHDRYDVATAISGKIAYKFLEKRSTDLILLDYEMPDENGPQVLTKLRENPEIKELPVFFLTGNTERDKIKQAMSLNPQGYLVKPIDKETLIDSIRKLIG